MQFLIDKHTFSTIPTININIGEMKMEVGDTFQIPYTFDSAEAYANKLAWSSSNVESICVDSEGKLTAQAVGQSIISVSFESNPDSILHTFRVFVFNDSETEHNSLRTEYDLTCEAANANGKYLIFFNIENPEMYAISRVKICVYTDYGMIPYEEVFEPPEKVRSNYAGEFALEYHDTYLVVGTIITEDGTAYHSEEHILRPYTEVE